MTQFTKEPSGYHVEPQPFKFCPLLSNHGMKQASPLLLFHLWQVDNIVTEPNATSTKFLLYGTRGDTEARPKWKKSSQPKGRSRGGPEQVQVRSRIQEMANSWYLVVLKINQARSSSKDGWVHVWSRVCLESSCMLGSSWILDWAREPRRRFLMTYHDSS